MNVTVTIYESTTAHRVRWTTLGLGEQLSTSREGPNPAKVEHALIEHLKNTAARLKPAELPALFAARGMMLERLPLELNIPAPGGAVKKSGTFPLVLEPRATADDTIVIAYHPAAQADWFPVNAGDSLASQASLHLARALARVPEDELLSERRDRLRTVSFTVSPRTLLDEAGQRKRSLWEDLAGGAPGRERRPPGQVLREIGVDDTLAAASGWLAPGVPRAPWRDELQRLLGRERPVPVVLLGPPGVGKSVLLDRAVHDLLQGDDYDSHRNLDRVRHVWRVTGRRLIAGMSYVGDWEQRASELVAAAKPREVLLRVPDLARWCFVGRSRDSDRNLAELFRVPLCAGEVAVVGESTAEQWQRLVNEAPSFAALFTPLHVRPTSAGDTMRLLFHEARALEARYRVEVDPLCFRTLVDVGGSLFPAAAFPGKALTLLRETARRAEPLDDGLEPTPVGPADVLALLAEKTGLPRAFLEGREPLDPADVARDLTAHVRGQPAAILAATDLVLRLRAGLTDPRRPYAVMLLSGPTGTGKTELARCLAAYLYGGTERLLRFDMSELGGPDAVARLVGDRWDPAGLLTTRIRAQPFAVVLLDEIEKAHPSVFPLLLQLFDEGRLTDAKGDVADFTHAVILMTSNLGASGSELGFAAAGEGVGAGTARVKKAAQEFFSPELFNRIDRLVAFQPLSAETAREVAGKELTALLSRWGLFERQVVVTCGERPLQRVVREGFDRRYGARTVKRWLEEHVASLLVESLTSTPAAAMRAAHLYERDGVLRLHVEALREAEPQETPLALAPLIGLSAADLHALLPAALDTMDALLADEATVRLSAEVSDRLARHNLGETGHADVLFHIESLRLALPALRRRLGFQRSTRTPNRLLMLELLAEVEFHRRLLRTVQDPAQHTVMVTLVRLGLGRARPRFGAGDGLLEAMARAMAGRRRVVVESAAARVGDGPVLTAAAERKDALDGLLRRSPDVLALELSGLGVLDLFGGEAGCHVWRSLQGAEVVRVDVGAPVEGGARTHVVAHATAVQAFRDALEAGDGVLPANPEGLRPAVREIRFDPPSGNRQAPLQVEDFALGHAEAFPARSLSEALSRLWLLRLSRVD